MASFCAEAQTVPYVAYPYYGYAAEIQIRRLLPQKNEPSIVLPENTDWGKKTKGETWKTQDLFGRKLKCEHGGTYIECVYSY